MRPIALIPAYKPSVNVIEVVQSLLDSDIFQSIICVDDGSGIEFCHIFEKLNSLGVTILCHAVNLGKGNALKTGINYIALNYPETIGAVTLDADGQHTAKDCIAVAKALNSNRRQLVLGVRLFNAATVPLRSKFGNIVTRYVTRFFAGVDVSDTQTGLRGIPTFIFASLLKLKSGGYDFELDMLMTACDQKVSILEVPIETVYIDNNASSNFNPFWDSVRIYMVFLRFNISAFFTFILDFVVFWIVFAVSSSIGLSIVFARLCAGLFNYTVNRSVVFKSSRRHAEAMSLYFATVLVMGLIAYYGIAEITKTTGINVYIAKVMVESVLFVFSFIIQRDFVFYNKRNDVTDKNETNWASYYKSRGCISSVTSAIAFWSFKRSIATYATEIKSIAELGGANSIFYDRFKSNFPEVKLYLIDKCPHISTFREKVLRDINSFDINTDILLDEFRQLNDSVDCVVSFGLIEHFNEKDTETMIAKHFTLVKPGGIVYLSFPTPTLLYRITRKLLTFIGKWPFHDERPLTFDEVLKTAEQYGRVVNRGMSYRLGLTQGVIIVRKHVL